MNWITEYVPPKIKDFFKKRESPENLWTKCRGCGQMIFHRELTENLMVCPGCNHHLAIRPRERFEALFDDGAFTELEIPEVSADPLQFRDSKRYADRIRDARRNTGEREAMLVAHGEIHGVRTVAAAQDFSFMGGSMGMAVGNALLKAALQAVDVEAPLVVFSAAGGARMQEGILSLMQMPRTTIAVDAMREAHLPFVVVLTHPTTGGVTASYAMLGDVHLAEPDALICFAGPRVIEQTIRETLPEGFQRSEYLLEHGMIDRVVSRKDMRDELGVILRMLMGHPPRVRGDLPAPDVDGSEQAQQEDPIVLTESETPPETAAETEGESAPDTEAEELPQAEAFQIDDFENPDAPTDPDSPNSEESEEPSNPEFRYPGDSDSQDPDTSDPDSRDSKPGDPA